MPHHSASIGSSFNTTIKGLTLEELREKFLKQPIDFSGEGGSFFARMGLLGKYVLACNQEFPLQINFHMGVRN